MSRPDPMLLQLNFTRREAHHLPPCQLLEILCLLIDEAGHMRHDLAEARRVLVWVVAQLELPH